MYSGNTEQMGETATATGTPQETQHSDHTATPAGIETSLGTTASGIDETTTEKPMMSTEEQDPTTGNPTGTPEQDTNSEGTIEPNWVPWPSTTEKKTTGEQALATWGGCAILLSNPYSNPPPTSQRPPLPQQVRTCAQARIIKKRAGGT
jgi:hypothetical protein